MDEVDEKINNFINLLKERTIKPIETMDIKESCTATLLLIFAAIDSLSKITCEDKDYRLKDRGVGKRFKGFLKNIMSDKYSNFRKEIYELRNDLVHTGINTKVILSKNQLHNKHLQKVNGIFWINTLQFFNDFKTALENISIDIKNKGTFFQNARKRLKEFNVIKLDNQYDKPTPSPGPEDSLFQ